MLNFDIQVHVKIDPLINEILEQSLNFRHTKQLSQSLSMRRTEEDY